MKVTGNTKSLASLIVSGLHQNAKPETKEWFSNYVKGTTWIGTKVPTVRKVVQNTIKNSEETTKMKATIYPMHVLIDESIILLQQDECDVKLAGMILLSEFCPIHQIDTAREVLDRLIDQILEPQTYITDWSTADWFAVRVLQKIAYGIVGGGKSAVNDTSSNNHELALKIVNFARDGTTLWYRRCGIVTFVNYYNNRDKLPPNFASTLMNAAEQCLLASPEERFTQTGCAWMLRYALTQKDDADLAMQIITRHSHLWTTEAKKSMVEKLPSSHKLRKQILLLSSDK
jgi:hypothetical protein